MEANQITMVTPEQAEQIKQSIIRLFDYEIDNSKNLQKEVNLSVIERMIAARTEIYK